SPNVPVTWGVGQANSRAEICLGENLKLHVSMRAGNRIQPNEGRRSGGKIFSRSHHALRTRAMSFLFPRRKRPDPARRSRRTAARRGLRIESLETRQMMAANLTANIISPQIIDGSQAPFRNEV